MKLRINRWLRGPRPGLRRLRDQRLKVQRLKVQLGRNAPGAFLLVAFALLGLSRGPGRAQAAGQLGTDQSGSGRAPEVVQRVSLSRLGAEGNSDSFAPSVSGDGRYVAFVSSADNLVDGDHNGVQDVFLYDRQNDTVVRISMGYAGSEANGRSNSPVISRDGRYVAFVSQAGNLVPDDRNGVEDVFLYESQSKTITRISVGPGQQEGKDRSLQPSISAEGRFVAFVSLAENLIAGDNNGMSDVLVYDRVTGNLELITVGDDGQQADFASKYPAISADGRFVAFQTKASNLVPGDDNEMYDVFVRDRYLQVTELVSRAAEGGVGNHDSQHPSISDNGRFVAFDSWADNLVAGDDNGYSDVFLVDRQASVTELVSVDNEGRQAGDVNGAAAVADDGSLVAFVSRADNLSPQDDNRMYDVYLRDRRTRETRLISMGRDGQAGDGPSISPSLTTSGAKIVFDSLASDLVADDTNARVDVFVFDAFAGVTFTHTAHLPLVIQQ